MKNHKQTNKNPKKPKQIKSPKQQQQQQHKPSPPKNLKTIQQICSPKKLRVSVSTGEELLVILWLSLCGKQRCYFLYFHPGYAPVAHP